MTAIHRDLEKIGLTPNQALVYLTLFRATEAKAGEIIKKTGLHRNLVYVSLQELTDKKLVTSSKVKGVTIFKMLSPTRLLSDLQEKERVAKGVVEELSLLGKSGNEQEIIVYEGIEEFRRHVLRSYAVAKRGDLIRYLGTSPRWHEVVGPELEGEIYLVQKEKKLRMRGISKISFPAIKEYLRNTAGLTELRINPLISSDTNNVEILNDRICIQSFVEPYSVVEIINKEVAKNYQNYFDFLWKNSKVVK